MFSVLAESCPQQPNMSALYRELETDRNQGLKMLSALERAGLLAVMPSDKATLKDLSRPEKIYCDNSNIMSALVSRPDVGTVRETFFVNQLRGAGHRVSCARDGDFKVDGLLDFWKPDGCIVDCGGRSNVQPTSAGAAEELIWFR